MSKRIELRNVKLTLIWGLIVSLMIVGIAQAGPNWRNEGTSQASQMAQNGEQCVRETPWMRRNHMDLLQHDRDVTVHNGVRTLDGSLKGCVTCHVNKDDGGKHVPVTAMEGPDGSQFCAGCHAYTGVALDCFQCHSTVPTE